MHIYYVYAYLRQTDNTPYYIGKGKGKRIYGKHSVPVPKDKSKIIFYQTGLLEDDAFKLEQAYIKLFGCKDIGTGILRNLSNGGEGPGGFIRSDTTKHKLSLYAKNRTSEHQEKLNKSRKHYRHSDETRQKISKLKKGKLLGPRNEETKKKISLSNKNKHSIPHSEETKKKISQSTTGIKKGPISDTHRSNISKSKKGYKCGLMNYDQRMKISKTKSTAPKFLCQYCNNLFKSGNYSRWHGNNCKFKAD